MSQSPFSQVFRKGFSLTQGGRTPAEDRVLASVNAVKTGDRPATAARRTNVLYLVGDARETKFVSGAFDKAYPHLNLDFSVEPGDARQHLGEAGRYDALMVGWSLPEAEALSLIGHVREQGYPLAIVAASEQSPERFRKAGADEFVQKGASFLARLPVAIEEALQKRSNPNAAPPSPVQSLRVAYAGDLDFVKTALKGEASSLQFIAVAEALQGTACDVVVIDHTPSANTATMLADVRARNLDVPVVLLFNPPDEGPVLKTFASDINEFVVKTPGWATRLSLRLSLASTRHQQLRDLASLRVKEARLRTLVDSLPVSIVRLSPEGTVLAVNSVALSLLGGTESRQLLRKQFYSLVNPGDRDSCSEFVTRVCGGEQRSIEVAITTLTGEGRVVQIKAIPIAAEAGGNPSTLTVLRDVTDRKRLEASLEQATSQLSQTGSAPVHEVERFGEAGTVIERPTVDQAETPVATDPGMLRQLEVDLRRLSGRARATFEELEASLRDAEARHEAVSARQLEERAKLEALQLERWRSYEAFVQSAAHSIFHATFADDLLDVNPAFATALGYDSPDDLIAEGTSISRFTPVEEWRLAVERWRHASTAEPIEARWKRKDSGVLSLRLHGRPIGGPQGDDERLEVIAENVTALRALESQLRRARKWEDVARVTTGIAADLKYVVESLNESTDRLVADLPQDDNGHARAVAIQQGASKALSLSRQLVAFGRKEARDPEALDLNAVVRALESVVRRVADEHIELTLDLASEVGRIVADQPTVEETLVNLSVAACEALPAGGRIDIATTNIEVEQHSAEHPPGIEAGSYVLLSLTATGWGIEDVEDRLSRKPLVSVNRAIGQIGGCLKVEGMPGESVTFRVYLPHVQQMTPAVES